MPHTLRPWPIPAIVAFLISLGCSQQPAGPGPWSLILPGGDRIQVRAVRNEHYGDGDVLHLFYLADRDIHDTLALRARARVIWPAFAPFVVAAGYDIGAITGEHPQIQVGSPTQGFRRIQRWGIVARRNAGGTWRLDGDTTSLPPPVTDPKPMLDRDGVPLRVARRPAAPTAAPAH